MVVGVVIKRQKLLRQTIRAHRLEHPQRLDVLARIGIERRKPQPRQIGTRHLAPTLGNREVAPHVADRRVDRILPVGVVETVIDLAGLLLRQVGRAGHETQALDEPLALRAVERAIADRPVEFVGEREASRPGAGAERQPDEENRQQQRRGYPCRALRPVSVRKSAHRFSAGRPNAPCYTKITPADEKSKRFGVFFAMSGHHDAGRRIIASSRSSRRATRGSARHRPPRRPSSHRATTPPPRGRFRRRPRRRRCS